MGPLSRHGTRPRLLWACAIAVVAAVVAVVVTRLVTDEGSGNAAAATPATQASAVARPAGPKQIPLRPELSRVVVRFVKTAVMREHASRATLLEGWRLTGPKLRRGTTLREWLQGTSSVTPFPDGAVAPGMQVDHSYANDALLELALYPKQKGTVPAGVFLIGLHRYGAGAKARWLVDYWAPHGSSSMPAIPG